MSNQDTYLGPNYIQKGPSSFELSPTSIIAKAPPTFAVGGIFSGWGLTDAPHRGTSSGSGKLSPLTPYIWDDLMNEQVYYRSMIDEEYSEIFNHTRERVGAELDDAKQKAKTGQAQSPVEMAEKDHYLALNLIKNKESEYKSKIASAHSLYGQNPFFLMKELPFRKVVESANAYPPDIGGAFQAIDRAYRSALELKRLSLEILTLSSQLEVSAETLSKTYKSTKSNQETLSSFLENNLSTINQEKNIHIELLPYFLQEKVVTTTGLVEKLTHSQSLIRYKTAVDNLISAERTAIGSYTQANPNIISPLSKPELEALENLVWLQKDVNFGKRWQDYHVSLLHAETARHLTETSSAFAKLIARAQETEALQNQARLAAEAETKRIAAEAETKRIADEQARAAADATRNANTFRASGPVSATSPMIITSAGTVAIIEAAIVSLQVAIRSAITALASLLAGTASGLFVGVPALFYAPKLGNGELPERFAFSTPLSELVPEYGQSLPATEIVGGTINLPVRFSSNTTADGRSEVVILKADDINTPSKVPVLAAKYNAMDGVYTVITGDVPPRILTWTPIVNPGNSSTTLPTEQPAQHVYTGAAATPIQGRVDTFPAFANTGFDDFITVFPADSGLPPIYVMFSNPYKGATTKGEYSGRMYNPDQAGGETQNLDWTTALVTQSGIELVKLHTGRFAPSDANGIMIDRLEKILRGEIPATDVDKRFYTHEIRELERFRTLGVADGVDPKDNGVIWNNTHAATLEDYKLKDRSDLFYTQEAIEADFKQIEREYK
ncbi:S-type pyocin domain-containing protein [Pseudomonas protegens]|uniref:S-type pyocin domain-containing protein n=1 Tax=Pseudomonas protegens TaxID=380021 RepID=UPI0022643B67|nr:S-type pyocin domain-containing protein [Pseudomonas protegens]